MNAVDNPEAKLSALVVAPSGGADRKRVIGYGVFLAVLLIAFAGPLLTLMGLASKEDLHSHVLLIPFITGYLLYIGRADLPAHHATSPGGTAILTMLGVGLLSSGFGFWGGAEPAGPLTLLAAKILALVCFVNAGGFLFMGSAWMRAAAFPMAFLLFVTPLPEPAVHWLEHHLKVASAEAAALMFDATALPYLRNGMVFEIPGIVIEVADECSGIRSSYVLFITSILASYLFLRSPWRRGILAAAVIPLGIIRNGFRILVIAWMCVEISPEMIHSFVHRRGGPIFFALSLVPLLGLAWWLRRGERSLKATKGAQ